MLFSKIWPPNIIEATEIKDWKTFSYEYAIDNGLNQLEAESFSDMISYFIGNGPAVSLDNKYYKVQKIQFDILGAIPDIRRAHENEIEQIKLLFDYVFIMYNEKIYQYTKKSEKVSFRITKKQYDDFMSVPGKDKADKLQTLLSSYYPPTSIEKDTNKKNVCVTCKHFAIKGGYSGENKYLCLKDHIPNALNIGINCDDYEKISKEEYMRLEVAPRSGRTILQERKLREALKNGEKVLLVDKETLKDNLLEHFHVIYKNADKDE